MTEESICQWHLFEKGRCNKPAVRSVTKKDGFVYEFCEKHHEKFCKKYHIKRQKGIQDMTDEEYQLSVIRRQFIHKVITGLREADYEDQYIYQVLLEELALLGTRLPRDKIDSATKGAQEVVGLEVNARNRAKNV